MKFNKIGKASQMESGGEEEEFGVRSDRAAWRWDSQSGQLLTRRREGEPQQGEAWDLRVAREWGQGCVTSKIEFNRVSPRGAEMWEERGRNIWRLGTVKDWAERGIKR